MIARKFLIMMMGIILVVCTLPALIANGIRSDEDDEGIVEITIDRSDPQLSEPMTPIELIPISLMTFNLHYILDQSTNWSFRQKVMAETVRRNPPHVLGVQEAQPEQIHSILSPALPHHELVQGPGLGHRNFHNSIFYDGRRFDYVDSGWKELPGGPVHSRFFVWVLLDDKLQNGQTLVANTHFTHLSESYQLQQANAMLESLPYDCETTYLIGDFNARYDGAIGQPFRDAGFVDTWKQAVSHRSQESSTLGEYQNPNYNSSYRIDWVLAPVGSRTRTAEIDHFNVDGQYPSDHYPVRATVKNEGDECDAGHS